MEDDLKKWNQNLFKVKQAGAELKLDWDWFSCKLLAIKYQTKPIKINWKYLALADNLSCLYFLKTWGCLPFPEKLGSLSFSEELTSSLIL